MSTNVYIKMNNGKSLPLKITMRGLLEVEDLDKNFNLNQTLTDLGVGNQALFKEGEFEGVDLDNVSEIKNMPRNSTVAKTIYAAHCGYCFENGTKPMTYDEFVEGMNPDFNKTFTIFARLISSDKKKHSAKNSKGSQVPTPQKRNTPR